MLNLGGHGRICKFCWCDCWQRWQNMNGAGMQSCSQTVTSPPVGTCSKDLLFHWVLYLFVLWKRTNGSVFSQSIYCLLPHQNNSSRWSYSEIQKYQNTGTVSFQASILSLYLGYFYISDQLLYWLLHWHLYIQNMYFFSKARVLRNNATHSLQMFMLFWTNYIYFCLLFTICTVPRLLENVILFAPSIKWHNSKKLWLVSWQFLYVVDCLTEQGSSRQLKP